MHSPPLKDSVCPQTGRGDRRNPLGPVGVIHAIWAGGGSRITLEKRGPPSAFREVGKSSRQGPLRIWGNGSQWIRGPTSPKDAIVEIVKDLLPPAVLTVDINLDWPQRAEAKRVANKAPILTRGQWGGALWRMDRLKRARSLFPRRSNKDRAHARDAGKCWIRAPRLTLPDSHGYGSATGCQSNRDVMRLCHIPREPSSSLETAKLKPFTGRWISPSY